MLLTCVAKKFSKLEIPNIGENGNWFIGNEDTGVSIQGPKGDKGDIDSVGPQGIQGDKGDTGVQWPKGDKGDTGR